MTTDLSSHELAIAGCILENPDLAIELESGWFYDQRAGLLVDITKNLLPQDKASSAAIRTKLDFPEKQAFIHACQSAYLSIQEFQFHREQVLFAYEKRRLGQAATDFIQNLTTANGNLPELVAMFESQLAEKTGSSSSVTGGKQLAASLIDDLEFRMANNGRYTGLTTGIPKLNQITDGLQFGEMTILGARPGIGKTAIALNIVHHCCLINQVPTLILSLEMDKTALCRRLLSMTGGIAMNKIRSGQMSEPDFQSATVFNAGLSKAPLHIFDAPEGLKAVEAASLIRRHARKHGVKLVVLDYLQKLRPDTRHEKKTYEIAEASGVIRAAAVRNKVALLCLAQLNRESEKEKGRMPRISDLADSGQIERDADNVLLLHRNRGDNPELATLFIAKQRDGEVGLIKLDFDGKHCRFTEQAL